MCAHSRFRRSIRKRQSELTGEALPAVIDKATRAQSSSSRPADMFVCFVANVLLTSHNK